MNMLLEDSSSQKVPKLLEDILKNLIENESLELIQQDILFLLIIILMVENGFMPILRNGVEWDCQKPIGKDQLVYWKPKESYEVIFLMYGYQDIPIQLVLCPIGQTMLVNVLVNHNETDVYSLVLTLKRYILSNKASAIPLLFNDLKHLSYTYKNKIIVPVKSKILNFYGFPSASLMGLPVEVFIHLLMKLSLVDILNIAKTCKVFRSMIEMDSFWHRLFIRDFKITNENDESSWKSQYIKKYIEEQEKSRKAQYSISGSFNSFAPQHYFFGVEMNNSQIWSLLFD